MKTLLVMLAFVATAFGADVAGEWKATAEGPNGTMERTLSLKVDGTKLTGETVSSFLGKSVIQEGKIEGDNFSFTIVAKFQDEERKLAYKGKVTGKDTMTLTSDFGGNSIEWKATRTK